MVRAKILLLVLTATAAWPQQSFIPSVVAVAPNRVLYGTYNTALVRSSDGGATWTPMYVVSAGLAQPPVIGFIVDPSNSSTLYLATTTLAGAIWRSSDAGATWTNTNSGLPTNLGNIDFFKQVAGPPSVLFAKMGNQLFGSIDGGNNWRQQGILPGSSTTFQIADYNSNTMYFIDSVTFTSYQSLDGGHAWSPVGSLGLGVSQSYMAAALGILYAPQGHLYVSVSQFGQGVTAYLSTGGGGSFADQTSVGLGPFSSLLSGPAGPIYAVATGPTGFYRSEDAGVSWQSIGLNFGTVYTLSAVDPNQRTTIYGIRGGASRAFVRSDDGGDTWTVISASVTPTIAKPASQINVTVEQGAPYSQAFTVQAVEDPTWVLAATVSTSGAPWLQLAATSGNTPFADSITIKTAGMLPGVYQAGIQINAPQAFNKTVTIPVQLTIQAFGSLGTQFGITTVAGNGNATSVATSGTATNIGIGAPVALSTAGPGGLLISAGNRIWQLAGGLLSVVAGNGTSGSSGDGVDATLATLANPEAIAFDQQGTLYFTEYSAGRVRKIVNNAITTLVDFSKFNRPASHGMFIDSTGRILLANSSGLLRFDGSNLVLVTAYAMTDPYGMISDVSGNIYVSDRGGHQIIKFPPTGAASVFAGLGTAGFGGDGGPAALALLNMPSGMAMDAQGTLYLADAGNQRIRTITADGNIHTIAGSGAAAFAGDGTTADFAAFLNPAAVALDASANLYVADTGNNRVRKLAISNASGNATPSVCSGCVVNAASYAKDANGSGAAVAPGSLVAIFTSALATSAAQFTTASLPESLASVSVTFNNVPAPMVSVTPGGPFPYVSAQVPFGVLPSGQTAASVPIVLTVNGVSSTPVQTPIVASAPGIFTIPATGQGNAILVNLSDYSVAAPPGSIPGFTTRPIPRGQPAFFYVTGLGVMTPSVADGSGTCPASNGLCTANAQPTVSLGGVPAQVSFAGQASGYPGVMQINITVPQNAPTGNSVPLIVKSADGSVTSNTATVAVQ